MTERGEQGEAERAYAAIAEYLGAGSAVALGRLPFEKYDAWRRDTQGARLDPDRSYTAAWIGLERLLAMPRATNPETGKKFKAKDIQTTRAEVAAELQALIDNPDAPLETRVRAHLTHSAIAWYEIEQSSYPATLTMNSRLPHVRANQEAARLALTEPDGIEPDFAAALAVICVLNEYNYNLGVTLLAAPRQPWHATSFNHAPKNRGARSVPIRIGEEENSNFAVVSPIIVGPHLWTALHAAQKARGEEPYWDLPNDHMATIAAYAEYDPGLMATRTFSAFALNDGRKRRIGAINSMLERLAEAVGTRLQTYELFVPDKQVPAPPPGKKSDAAAPPQTGITPEVVAAAETEELVETAAIAEVETEPDAEPEQEAPPEEPTLDLRYEAKWYLMQPSDDFAIVPERAFMLNLENLINSESLLPEEQRIASWMYWEYAAYLAESSETEEDLQVVGEWVDAALESFLAAAEGFLAAEPPKYGDACDTGLMVELAPVYKLILTGADPAEIGEAARHSLLQLASLFQNVRRNLANIHDRAQLETLRATAESAALTMLLTGDHEESHRHLVLPLPLRRRDRRPGAIAFHWNDGYFDASQPIRIEFTDGETVGTRNSTIEIGRRLLEATDENPLGLLADLVETIQPNLQRIEKKVSDTGRRRRVQQTATAEPAERTEAMQAFAEEVATRLDTLHAKIAEERRRASLSKNELKREKRTK